MLCSRFAPHPTQIPLLHPPHPPADGYTVEWGLNTWTSMASGWHDVASSTPCPFEYLLPEPGPSLHFGTSAELAVPPSITPQTPLVAQIRAVKLEAPPAGAPAGTRARVIQGPLTKTSRAFWTLSDVKASLMMRGGGGLLP